MAWVAMSDDVSENRKILAVGLLAEGLWRRSIEWSNRHLTDGFVPDAKVRTLADFTGILEERTDGQLVATTEPVDVMVLAQRLVREQLWEPVDGGFQIHHYLQYQPSAKQVRAERRRRRSQRAQAGRKGAQKRWSGDSESDGERDGERDGKAVARVMAGR